MHPATGEWSIDNCKFLFLTGVKKNTGYFVYNGQKAEIAGLEFLKVYSLDTQRFLYNAQQFINFMQLYDCESARLEGYAFGAKGKVFNIAEATGLLKYLMYKMGISFTVEIPSVIKKFATGKGNAKKDEMVDAFIQETGIDLYKLFEKDKVANPMDDIADSYFICKNLFNDINN